MSGSFFFLVPTGNTIVAAIMFHIHCCKRLYETTYVNVFSDKNINITQYLLGYIHYLGINLCLLGESDLFSRGICLKIF